MSSADVDRALSLPPDELGVALLSLPEDQWFERKSARVSARDFAVPLVAMGNADGGVVVVGLHDGQLEDVTSSKSNELRQAALDFTEPPVRVRVEEVTALTPNGGTANLLVARVDPGEHLHMNKKGEAYLRVGDESRRLTAAQQRELSFDRSSTHYEATALDDMSVADLDQEQIAKYARTIGADSVERALTARDLLTRKGQVTVSATLLFSARPQFEFPSAVVRILKYGADERGLGSSMTLEEGGDIRVEGSLPQQIHEASEHIDRMMPRWQQLNPAGLFEATPRIPRDAWLEGLVNAVVHRSYSMMGDHIRFEIFPNRVEVSSPGRFPGVVNPGKPLDIRRYARNPRIARVCADMGITRELGEGIKRVFAEMRRRGLVDPIYEQTSSSVKLTLLAADALPSEVTARLTTSAQSILAALRLSERPMGTGELAEFAGVTRMTATRALAALEQEGIITWRGNSKRDPRATWSLGQR